MSVGKSAPHKMHSFAAIYNYDEAAGESIHELPKLTRLFSEIIVRPFKAFTFYGASAFKNFWVNPQIVEDSKISLKKIGGQVVELRTPDGDALEGMYLSAHDFKGKCDLYLEEITGKDRKGKPVQMLAIKRSLYQPVSIPGKPSDLAPSAEAVKFLKFAEEELNLHIINNKELISDPIDKSKKIDFYFQGIVLPDNSRIAAPPPKDDEGSEPTVLICPGAVGNYATYKNLAASYLLRGLNVMMIDYRGYGKSEGSPTPHKLNLDVETAYQYLHKQKRVENKDLLLHGHCLGVGPAAHLAARRPGINLISDRSFAEYREVARHLIPVIGRMVHAILPWIVNYNNAENLQKIEGHMAIIAGKKDEVIPQDQTTKQIDSLPINKPGQHFKYIEADVEHKGLWRKDLVAVEALDQFLEQAGLRRRLF